MGLGERRERGTAAEERAALALQQAGYRIVARNVRLRIGELDIVAWEGEVLAFIEVRSRADSRFGGAGHAVGRAKQRQVARCAELYLGTEGRSLCPNAIRFDVVAVTGAELVILRDAFRC